VAIAETQTAPMTSRDRRTILLVAEAVTLAHFARIATLARALGASSYRVIVASDPRYAGLDSTLIPAIEPIESISSHAFSHALTQGKPLYDAETLSRYVEADLMLIDRIKPDLIVGDFRLSLSVSAPLRQIPYAALVNAYWSPYADIAYPIPDLPLTRLLGVGFAQHLFDLVRPLVFARHAQPLNRVRRKYGLPALGHDLRLSYSWADYTLYPDIPEIAPMRDLPSNHQFLGPVLWSTDTPLPDWWNQLPQDKPVVCLTLGSSGNADFLPSALRALMQLPITLIVATIGKTLPMPLPANVFHADYLPLQAALQRAQLLICNGGSLSTYQALACGVPVIGVCSNLDQLLNMAAMQRLGCGITLRAGGLAPAALAQAVSAMLTSAFHAAAARQLGERLKHYDSAQRFRGLVAEILP
jgi:UDP:flavonoid glycosyltransferase YjiC (YdhE family)